MAESSSVQLATSEYELKKISDGADSRAIHSSSGRAPVTSTLLSGAILAVLQSFNFGLGIGLVNLSAPPVQVALGLGAWMLNGSTALPDGTTVTENTPGATVVMDASSTVTWSWIVSIFAVGGVITGLAGGAIVGKFGPKKTILANNILFYISALLQAFATGPGMMMAGRVFCGLAAGILCSAVPMWVAESTPDHVRGAFGVFHQLFVTIGILVATILGMKSVFGNASSWPMLYGFAIVPSTINLIGFFFMPDSPRYLFAIGDVSGSEQALRRLRGPGYNVDPEIDQFHTDKKKEEEEGALSMVQALGAIFTRQYIKQTIIAIGLQICQQMSGINAIMFYSGSIFISAGFSNVELAAILVNTVNVAASVAAVPLIERAGRRGLSLFGFGGMAIAHCLFGIGMVSGWQIPTIIFMLLGVVCFAVGPGPIPWMITAEIFPAVVRNGAVGVAVFTNWLFTFAVGMFFPPLQEALQAYTFFFFCAWTVAITIFVFFFVPETKGKSMQEVQALFGNDE
eukprot:comp21623_c0_seq1/m.30338 comp21623_c0_seq1/g.30338  ORF comp21623_c0_seq1/g.30338 comp21623_c0_seq1/m.30338 type:complete len:513 (-) comp21623_c0_seq1:360-1898(-)